jgi:GAF domain-containing protein
MELAREEARSQAETEVLFRLSEVTSRAARPEDLYDPALDAMHVLLGAERASVLLFDDSNVMRFRAWRGLSDRYRAAVEGHSPWSADTKDPRPILIGDVADDESMEGYRNLFRAEGIAAIAFLPLVHQHQLLGKFMLYWGQRREFSRHDEELAVTIAAHIAQALDRARIQQAERSARDRLERMQTVIAALSRAHTAAEVANAACQIGAEAMAAVSGAMWLLQDGGTLSLVGNWGTPSSFINQWKTLPRDADAPAQWAAQKGEAVWVETAEDYQRVTPTIYETAKAAGRLAAFGAVPILGVQRPLGVITFGHALPHKYNADERAFYVSLAQYCAQALERALLFDERLEERRRIGLLQSVTASLSKAASEEEVIAIVVDEGTRLVGAPQGAIWLRSATDDTLRLAYSRGYGDTPVAPCACEEAALWTDNRFCVPLVFKGRALGAMSFDWPQAHSFTDDEKRLVEALALQAGQALERARLYDDAEAARRLFFSVLESVDYGITVLDRGGKLVFANAAGERHAQFEVLNESGQDGESVIRYRAHGTGEDRWAVVHAWPILDEDGHVFHVVRVFRDVTEQRRADGRRAFLLRATEQFNSSVDYEETLSTIAKQLVPELADWSAIDIVEGDKLHRLATVHVDPAKLTLVEDLARRYPMDPNSPGAPEQIVKTQQPFLIQHIPPELLRAAARNAENLALIEKLQLRSYIAVPMLSSKRVVGVLTLAMAESGRGYSQDDLRFAVDIAERAAIAVENARLFRETARALDREQQARADAEQAARFAELFIGILGHDLRSPLQAIGMSAQSMLRLATDDRQRRPALNMVATTARMSRMVDQLLDFTRIRVGGGLKLDSAAADLGPMAQLVAEETQAASGCTIKLERSGDTVGKWDADRLAQVFSNLLGNTVRHGTSGHPILFRLDGSDDNWVLIEVENRGQIPPEILPRIFEAFQGGQHEGRSGGLGLGLYISHAIVEAHGGTITVTSGDESTIFRLHLPRG